MTIFAMFGANAQEQGDIEFGLGFGLNRSNLSVVDEQFGIENLYSFNIAASGEYYFSDRWGMKMKIIYDNKGPGPGFFAALIDPNSIMPADVIINYITVPAMANWHFGKNRNWYLNFGPYIGFLIKAEDTKLDFDNTDDLKSIDIGFDLGMGYKFKVNDKIKIFIEYDVQSGFSEVLTGSKLYREARNIRESFNIGVLYNIRTKGK